MKKVLLAILIVMSLLLYSGFAVAANDFVIANGFNGQDGDGYWGPYGPAFTLENGALVFDSSIDNAWVTLNFKKDDNFTATSYKYLVITLKSDKPQDGEKVHMTLGNVGKSFGDWGITLDTNYKTYTIDLAANGVTKWGDAEKQTPDFALNKAEAQNAKIYLTKMVLTNSPSTSSSGSTSTTSSDNTSNPKTGDNTLGMLSGFGTLVIFSSIALIMLNKRTNKNAHTLR